MWTRLTWSSSLPPCATRVVLLARGPDTCPSVFSNLFEDLFKISLDLKKKIPSREKKSVAEAPLSGRPGRPGAAWAVEGGSASASASARRVAVATEPYRGLYPPHPSPTTTGTRRAGGSSAAGRAWLVLQCRASAGPVDVDVDVDPSSVLASAGLPACLPALRATRARSATARRAKSSSPCSCRARPGACSFRAFFCGRRFCT